MKALTPNHSLLWKMASSVVQHPQAQQMDHNRCTPVLEGLLPYVTLSFLSVLIIAENPCTYT